MTAGKTVFLSKNKMNNFNLLKKYQTSLEDWNTPNLAEMKIVAESVVSTFLILENTLAPFISPEELEVIDKAKTHILNYLDKHFIEK